MKTGIHNRWEVIGLATGLYREMLISALSLIPSVHKRYAQ